MEILHRGIYIEKNKYNNILIDLKTESIKRELLYDYPISLLFKFRLTKNKYLYHLDEVDSLDNFSINLKELEDLGYFSKYNINEDLVDAGILNGDDNKNLYGYNGYLGSYETYNAFKLLLQLYLDGISLYSYQGKYYTYNQFKEIYDITSFDHSKFCNDNNLNNHSNVEDTLKDVIEFNPDVSKITCKCIEVQDPGNVDKNGYLLDPLANLFIIFKAPLDSNIKKNRVSNSHKLIIMKLSDFL